MKPQHAGKHAAALLWWGGLAALSCAWMSPLEPSMLEEGYLLHFAQRMLHGEHLYRDLITFTGPLPFELLTLLFRLFGEEVAVGRAAVALLHGLVGAAIFDMARRGGLGVLAHAAAACVVSAPVLGFPLLSIFFYSTIAYLLCALATWATFRAIDSDGFAFAAGITVAAVALSKQTTGVVLAPALMLGLAFAVRRGERARRLLMLVAGGAFATAVTLAAFSLRGDLAQLFHALVLLPFDLEASFASPYPNLWPPGKLDSAIAASHAYYTPNVVHLLAAHRGPESSFFDALGLQLLYALPLFALIASLVRGLRGSLSPAAAIHLASLVAMGAGLFPRSDWGHLVYVLPQSLIQLCLLSVGQEAPVPEGVGPPRQRTRIWTGLQGALTAALLATTGIVGVQLHRLAGPASLGPRIPQKPVSAVYRGPGLRRVIEYLRERVRPGEAIFVARMEPLVYFATDTVNPTPYGGVIPGIRDQQQDSIIRGLETVRFVVMSDVDRPIFTYYRDELPAVQSYLERHYQVAAPFNRAGPGRISVLERGADRGPTAVDLVARSRSARAWTRDVRGREQPIQAEPPRLATRLNRRPLATWIGAGGGGIDFEVRLPEGARFQTDFGLRLLESATGSAVHADKVQLVLSIAEAGGEPATGHGEDPGLEALARITINYAELAGTRWHPFEVDLSAYGGRRVRLRLETLPAAALGRSHLSWWGSPRIATPPGRGEARGASR